MTDARSRYVCVVSSASTLIRCMSAPPTVRCVLATCVRREKMGEINR